MPLEKPPINQPEVPPTAKNEGAESPDSPEKLITSEPKLRYISKTHELLKPEIGESGEKVQWMDLYKKVKPYRDSLELSDNVREVIREWVAQKIPNLKNKIPSIEDLDDEKLLSALSNGWFEEIRDETHGQR